MSQTEPKIPTNFTAEEICELVLNVIPDEVECPEMLMGVASALGLLMCGATKDEDRTKMLLLPVNVTIVKAIRGYYSNNAKDSKEQSND